MSSISSMLSGFFQLPNSQTGSTGNNSTAATATPSMAQALAAADTSSQNNSNNSNSSVLLDLSPTAQNYLQQVSSGLSNATSSAGSGGFVLSNAQKQQIAAILAKYKDAPYTQDTFNQIQNDLQAAGLSPKQLAMTDQMRQFNPVSVLVDALSGKSDGLNPMDFGNSADENANATSYMQQIASQWKTISTPAQDTTSGGGSDSPAGSSAS